MRICAVLLCAAWVCGWTSAFSLASKRPSYRTPLSQLSATAPEDDGPVQWELFKKHHAKGSWKGVWTSFDYIGDVIDETVASVDLDYDAPTESIQQTHRLAMGATVADCSTCFDSMEFKSFPVQRYMPTQLHKTRLGSIGMINGPSLLRSGAMATELVLALPESLEGERRRVRVAFQHAPVWRAGVEPGSGPPDGLKLFRTMVSRESLGDVPPTRETETNAKIKLYRGVPPFRWHAEWAGTSWTWGPTTGNRGWSLDKMDEADAWHGRPTGDSPNVWNLRLPGGILLQAPRIINGGETSLFRLAWLPTEECLLRMEAGVLAFQPVEDQGNDVVAFYPPSLASMRCDILQKVGELEEQEERLRQLAGESDVLKPRSDEELSNVMP